LFDCLQVMINRSFAIDRALSRGLLCQEAKRLHPSAHLHFGPQAGLNWKSSGLEIISPGIEFYFNQFPGFVRYRSPPPFANSVFGRLGQYRMPAPHFKKARSQGDCPAQQHKRSRSKAHHK
jgi:hypothetical protein